MTDQQTTPIAEATAKCQRGCGEMGSCHPNLTAEFLEAVDLAEEGVGYTPEYFREKWLLDERLAKLQAIRDKLGGA